MNPTTLASAGYVLLPDRTWVKRLTFQEHGGKNPGFIHETLIRDMAGNLIWSGKTKECKHETHLLNMR